MPRRSDPAFRLSPFYDDGDGQAYACSVEASSAAFSGYTEVELVASDLRAIGARLRDFRASGLQSEIVWELPGWMVGPASRLRFYIRDRAGHAGIHATLAYGGADLEMATLFIEAEVAALNRLGERLLAWASGQQLEDDFDISTKRLTKRCGRPRASPPLRFQRLPP